MIVSEYYDKDNPGRLWTLNVSDLNLDGHPNTTKESCMEWLRHDTRYTEKCTKKRAANPNYTFHNFNDVLEYVKKVRDNVDPIQIEERLDGSKVIFHGKHRYIACKFLDVKTIRCTRIIIREVGGE